MRRRAFLLGSAAMAMGGCSVTPSNPALAKVLASDKVTARGPASALDIASYESTYGVHFSKSYRDFLLAANGMDTRFDIEALKRAGVSTAIWDVDTIFGIGNGDERDDLALLTPRWHFYDRRFLAFAPAVGVGGDFCTFSEVTSGTHAGKIMYTDGEMFSGIRKEFVEGRPVDETIERWLKAGYFMPIAPSFDALIEMYAKVA